jgi:hypothetical protein
MLEGWGIDARKIFGGGARHSRRFTVPAEAAKE